MNLPTPDERQRAQKLHNEAMDKAEEAFLFQRKGYLVFFEQTTREALEAETAAATLIAPYVDMEPTRSVLHRSAAALALDLGEWRIAERLICTALSGSPPPEIAEELRDMLETVISNRRAKSISTLFAAAKQ